MTTSDPHSQKHLQPLQHKPLALGDRQPGATPGTLAADPPRQPASLEVMAYSANKMTDLVGLALSDVKNLRRNFDVCWVNVVGVDDSATLQAIGEEFGIHQLVLEDIQHTNQRPKSEVHGEMLFMVVPMPDDDGQLEQMSILLGRDFVLTFNERPGDCFQVVRRRLQYEHLRLRQSLADYLAYTLVDAIVDRFAPLLDDVHEAIDELEDRILHRARPEHLRNILEIRKRLVTYRKVIRSTEAALMTLLGEEEAPFFKKETRPFLRDTADHAARTGDMVDTQRELTGGLLDLYQGQMAHAANEASRVLTIIATLFIPLSFITGLYGMNFERETSGWNMPELGWKYGYPFALGMMVFAALGLLFWMWRKGFLTSQSGPDDND